MAWTSNLLSSLKIQISNGRQPKFKINIFICFLYFIHLNYNFFLITTHSSWCYPWLSSKTAKNKRLFLFFRYFFFQKKYHIQLYWTYHMLIQNSVRLKFLKIIIPIIIHNKIEFIPAYKGTYILPSFALNFAKFSFPPYNFLFLGFVSPFLMYITIYTYYILISFIILVYYCLNFILFVLIV